MGLGGPWALCPMILKGRRGWCETPTHSLCKKVAFYFQYFPTVKPYLFVALWAQINSTKGGIPVQQSHSYKHEPLYIRALVAGVNLALWPIKAYGLAQDEQVVEMPTGNLCTGHLFAAMALAFLSFIFGVSLVIGEILSPLTVLGCITALYLSLGVSLRYWVGRRCNTNNYNYVRANLDLLQ